MLRVVPEDDARQEFALTLDEICRRGAERMLAVALEAEVDAYLERHRDERDSRGRALVVRNGSAGLSAAAITRLTTSWSAEREAFMNRNLSEVDYVYCWVDGVHFTVRLGDDDRLCVLVMVGVRTDGTKELVAIADGYRESTESWAELLRDCRRRGMRAPVLAVGDGALGFWGAVRDVFPETRWQRDWVHKVANVLNALPASVQAQARRALREIWDAEDKSHAERALDTFARDFAKWPKA